jgi:squalene-hopene/tetraprenyl-beta-curcumene cyclase
LLVFSTIQDLAAASLRADLALAGPPHGPLLREPLDAAIDGATRHLLSRQRPDGHWVFELEADATIPS